MRRSEQAKYWIIAAVVLLLLGTPFIIKAFASKDISWEELADASQIYASIFSAVALAGVAGSLMHQARQSGIAAHMLARANQRELWVLAMQDPSLAQCFAPPGVPQSEERFKQIGFANLILAGVSSSYLLGFYSDESLVSELRVHFRGEIARQHWELRGAHWTAMVEQSGERPHRSSFALLTRPTGRR
ncbi:hypothetical protein GCM10010129_80510 [Streptomyces fumigatiscleroticus]|nr:hypothetical protein GCM10010129_80510 [Streptomyces fumigatiscleroticus]